MVSGLWQRPWTLRSAGSSVGGKDLEQRNNEEQFAHSVKTVLPMCPTPAQGGWEEHRRDEQWSAVVTSLDLCTKEHHRLIHLGATSLGGSSALQHYSESGVLPSPCSQVSFAPHSVIPEFLWFPNSILSGLLKNSRRALKYAIMTVRETWKGEFAKIFTV